MAHLTTIERHILNQQTLHPEATGTFTGLLADIALAAKVIARQMRYAGLNTVDSILGGAGTQNVHGENQQKLDVFADQTLVRIVTAGGRAAAIASEENESYLEAAPGGKYVLVYDPLDGSSNIETNVGTGTIWALYRRVDSTPKVTTADVLQPGRALAAAGYILYGPRTMFVYTTGQGVFGFTLDQSLGEFLLTQENLRMPSKLEFFGVNHGREKYWTPGVRAYVRWLQGLAEEDSGVAHGPNGTHRAVGAPPAGLREPLVCRYTGSLVMDFHRTLMRGGVFLYPGDTKAYGKLRLLYECAPLAFIAEQAGGMATDGVRRLLDVVPSSLHQIIPIFIGHRDLVECVPYFLAKYDELWVADYRQTW